MNFISVGFLLILGILRKDFQDVELQVHCFFDVQILHFTCFLSQSLCKKITQEKTVISKIIYHIKQQLPPVDLYQQPGAERMHVATHMETGHLQNSSMCAASHGQMSSTVITQL